MFKGCTGTCTSRTEDRCALVPDGSVLKAGRKRKAWKPQKGMPRLRERATALGGENAGVHSSRELSSALWGFAFEGPARGGLGEAHERKASRVDAASSVGENPREEEAQEGIGRWGGTLNRCCWRHGSTAGAKPWRREIGLWNVRFDSRVPRQCLS